MTDQPRGEGKVAVVTGGGTGIGAAAARRLHADGFRVAVCGRRIEPLRLVADEVDGLAVATDITSDESVERLIANVVGEYGRLDGLVLNAGIVIPGKLGEVSVADWEATMAANLTGAFLVFRHAVPYLLEAKGSVVSVASVSALRSAPDIGVYAVSKAGLLAFTQAITVDYAGQGLRANVVCPGWVRTPMADEEVAVLAGGDVDAGYAAATRLVPQRRAGDPEEVAEAIAWLLSGDASYVNGAVLSVDGGTAIMDPGTAAFLD